MGAAAGDVTREADGRLLAAVLAAGLRSGAVHRADVVQWADAQIAAREQPPIWIIDLALTGRSDLRDVIGLLSRQSEGVAPLEACQAFYALLPDVSEQEVEAAEAAAELIHHVALACLGLDWRCGLLRETDELTHNFGWARQGYVEFPVEEAAARVRAFAQRYRNEHLCQQLAPVHLDIPPRSDKGPTKSSR